MNGTFIKTSIVDIHTLKPHPDHDFYCGNIPEKYWMDFKNAIKLFGADKIVVSKDMTVVSGWQRVKACRELGRRKIAADIYDYDSPDDIIWDLITLHLWQHRDKQISGANAIIIGRGIRKLEDISASRNKYSV